MKKTNAAAAGLFDRLVDNDPNNQTERRPLRTMNAQELRDSVSRDLGRLLNTRCPITNTARKNRGPSVIDYGVPDFSGFTLKNPDHQDQLAIYIRETIQTYEPRLRDVQVHIGECEEFFKSLSVQINATLTNVFKEC